MKTDIILSTLSKLYAKRDTLSKEIAELQKKIAAEAQATPAEVKPTAKAKVKRAAKPKKPV
jgi:uncharacterized protein YfcZ (UPF0381/DUF406 family)